MKTTFPDWLRLRMDRMKIDSQADLMRLINRRGVKCSAATVSSWLTGTRIPRPSTLVVLLDVLGVEEAEDRAFVLDLLARADAA